MHDSPQLYRSRGLLAESLGDLTKAVEMYTYGLYIDPENEELLGARARMYLELHQYELALQDARNAMLGGNSEAVSMAVTALIQLNQLQTALDLLSSHPSPATPLLSHSLQQEILQTTSLASSQTSQIRNLTDFVTSAGGILANITIKTEENERFVVTTSYIPANFRVMFIPKSRFLTVKIAKKSEIGRKIENNGLKLVSYEFSLLAAYLLYENEDKNSAFRSYLDSLPANFDNFPVSYHKKERKLLKNSPFLTYIDEKIANIEKDYEVLCDFEREFGRFSLLDFVKMRLLISSRVFTEVKKGRKRDVLVPVGDMMDHGRPSKASWRFDEVEKGFVTETVEGMRRGEEVSISYGRKTNYQFLFNYGFVLPNNDISEYPLHISLNPNDPFYPQKLHLLENKHNYPILLVNDTKNRNFSTIFSIFRLLECFDSLKIAEISQKSLEFPPKIPPISKNNEISAIRRLLSTISPKIQNYSSDFISNLSNSTLKNVKNIGIILENDLKVLNWYRNLCELALNCLETGEIGENLDISGYEEYILGPILELIS